jgi:hypothetical protein
MRAYMAELAILNLTTRVEPDDPNYLTQEDAWQILREECPVDFGTDLEKWSDWVQREFTNRHLGLPGSKEGRIRKSTPWSRRQERAKRAALGESHASEAERSLPDEEQPMPPGDERG